MHHAVAVVAVAAIAAGAVPLAAAVVAAAKESAAPAAAAASAAAAALERVQGFPGTCNEYREKQKLVAVVPAAAETSHLAVVCGLEPVAAVWAAAACRFAEAVVCVSLPSSSV